MKSFSYICSIMLTLALALTVSTAAFARQKDSLETNKRVIMDFYSAVENGDLATLGSYFTSSYSIEEVGPMKDTRKSRISETSEDITERIKYLREALPGFRIKINRLVAEGDTVFADVTLTGVQKGPFLGVEPTGREIEMRAFVIYELENSKIKNALEMWDQLGVMKQLGYIKID